MASTKQLEANRRNSLKSTGPTSAAGKAASSLNALKTGIYAKSMIVKGEKKKDLDQLIAEYYHDYPPTTAILRAILDELITCEWMLRRLSVSETAMWLHQEEDSWTKAEYPRGKVASQGHKSFGAMQRRLDSTRRSRDRALAALREHAATPISLPPQPEPQPLPPQPEAPPAPPQPETPAITPSPTVASPQIGFVPTPSPIPFPAQPNVGGPANTDGPEASTKVG